MPKFGEEFYRSVLKRLSFIKTFVLFIEPFFLPVLIGLVSLKLFNYLFVRDSEAELHKSCESGDVLKFETCMKKNVNLGCRKGTVGIMPMMILAKNGYGELLEILLGKMERHKFDINDYDYQGKTTLHYAIEGEHFDIVQKLIARNATIDAKCNNGITPLLEACSK